MPPIADSVMAIHLVVDGGQHFWIEPKSFVFGIEAQLTDDKKLPAFYGNDEFGGPLNFNVIRNDDLFPNQIRIALLSDPDPEKRKAGLFIWQMITSRVFIDQQKDSDYEAVSYAVMDTHDYFDRSCNVNVQSIEVFFDSTKPMLHAFVEALLTFEIGQEINQGRAFVGYISLRFMGPTRALLGPKKFPVTFAVEVAGLADVVGTKELIDFAVTLALNPNFGAKLHWGQRNDSNRAQIETCFGNPAADPSSPMAKWRTALRELTKNGQLTGFSSEFTRRTGLEPF